MPLSELPSSVQYTSISEALKYTSLCIGFSQTTLFAIALICILYEPIKVKSSDGLSFDLILINTFGYLLLVMQDCFGIQSPKSQYSNEVHITDLIFSFVGMTFCYCGQVVFTQLPRTSKLTVSWFFGIMPIVAGILVILIMSICTQEMNSVFRTCGSIKACISLMGYCPQIQLIFRNKSTKGWSIKSSVLEFTGGCLAIVQIVIDFFCVSNGEGFFASLNYGKFFLNFFCCVCCSVIFFQHFVLFGDGSLKFKRKNPAIKYSTNLDKKGGIVTPKTQFPYDGKSCATTLRGDSHFGELLTQELIFEEGRKSDLVKTEVLEI